MLRGVPLDTPENLIRSCLGSRGARDAFLAALLRKHVYCPKFLGCARGVLPALRGLGDSREQIVEPELPPQQPRERGREPFNPNPRFGVNCTAPPLLYPRIASIDGNSSRIDRQTSPKRSNLLGT